MGAPIPLANPDGWRKVLRRGDRGADVAAWQVVLLDAGAVLSDIAGEFGDSTHNATLDFQRRYGLGIDGVVGPWTRGAIGQSAGPAPEPTFDLDAIPFVEARQYSKHLAPRDAVNWVVIHSMETPETATRAEVCAANMARWDRRASCHYCFDADSVVQCVREDMVAWHCPGANRRGIGLEHAGRARQTAAEWRDDFSSAMLRLSARQAARICARWGIPAVYVDEEALRRGERGITTHAAVGRAFGKTSHWDPGPQFPMAWYVSLVRDAMGE